MGWSFKIGQVAGTELRIHGTFVLLLAWLGLAYYWQGGPAAAAQGLTFILALFGCVLLHELGHAMAARLFGIATPDITLLPIGGVARLQRMPERPAQEIIVALAGPAVNVVIAVVLFGVLGRLIDPMQMDHLRQLDDPRIGLIAKLATINVWLVLFNMLPAFPMDGGRVLRAMLALFMKYARATRVAAGIGQAMAFVFGFLGLFLNPFLLFIALFVYMGASQEAAMAEMKEMARGLMVSDAMVTEFVPLREHDTLEEAVEALLRTSQHEFPVVDDAGRIVGALTQDDMLRAYRQGGAAVPVARIMRRKVPTVSAYMPFEKAFQQMHECQCPLLAVVDPLGRVIGLITPENVGEMMLLASASPSGALPSWRPRRGTGM